MSVRKLGCPSLTSDRLTRDLHPINMLPPRRTPLCAADLHGLVGKGIVSESQQNIAPMSLIFDVLPRLGPLEYKMEMLLSEMADAS